MKLSIAEVKRRLPVGTEYVGEYVGGNARNVKLGGRIARRRVTKQTSYEMTSEVLTGPNSGSIPHLTWQGQKAREDDGAIIILDHQGDQYFRITIGKDLPIEDNAKTDLPKPTKDVSDKAWAGYQYHLSLALVQFEKLGWEILRTDADNAFFDYFHIKSDIGCFKLGLGRSVNTDETALKTLASRWDSVKEIVVSFENVAAPFHSSIHTSVKAVFNDTKAGQIAYQIVCAAIENSGKKVWS